MSLIFCYRKYGYTPQLSYLRQWQLLWIIVQIIVKDQLVCKSSEEGECVLPVSVSLTKSTKKKIG